MRPLPGYGIPYLSHQNDNLRQELSSLANDVPPAVDFVAEVGDHELEGEEEVEGGRVGVDGDD